MKKILAKIAVSIIATSLFSSFLLAGNVAMAGTLCSTSKDCPSEEYCDGAIEGYTNEDSETREPILGTCKLSDLKDTKFSVSKNLKLDNGQQPQKYFGDKQNSPIVAFILSVIDFATIVIGSIAVILIIISGFMFMFAQGNEQNLTNAKDMFKYAVIGLLVVFLSYTIATFVQSIFLPEPPAAVPTATTPAAPAT